MTACSLPAAPVPPSLTSDRFGQWQRWGRLGAEFAAGQVTLQFLNLLVGFVLLRWLAKEDYAQFSFAFGFQSMLGMLLDLGATGAITALVGTRSGDPAVVGGYVAAAKAMRLRLAAFVLPVGALGFFLAGAKHGWPHLTTALLLAAVAAAVFAQGNASIHAAPLLMHRRLRAWYQVGSLAAAGRLVFIMGLYGLGALSGWLTAWVNTVATGLTAVFYRRAAAGTCVEPGQAPVAMQREMWRYLAPLIPGVVFTAFQGQITVFLITLFGRTDNIAEVAALGRVGQIFALLGAFNGVVLQPHMAALPRERVLARYLQALAAAILVSAALCSLGWVWPDPLLWLLGGHYAHLGPELRLLLLSASLSYVGSVMWTMHSARKWIYWWGSGLFIGATLLVQGGIMATHDLSTTRAAMEFAVWSSLVPLAVHAITAVYAFVRRK
jgi:O-antigen/teichoic acid export membrane protein